MIAGSPFMFAESRTSYQAKPCRNAPTADEDMAAAIRGRLH